MIGSLSVPLGRFARGTVPLARYFFCKALRCCSQGRWSRDSGNFGRSVRLRDEIRRTVRGEIGRQKGGGLSAA